MKKKWKIYILIFGCLVAGISFQNKENTYAITKQAQKQHILALKAYKSKLLEIVKEGSAEIGGLNYTDQAQFVIRDLNNDGIEELIMSDHGWQVFAFYNGDIKKICGDNRAELLVYKKGSLISYRHAAYMGISIHYFFQIEKGEYKEVATKVIDTWNNNSETYEINGKPVTNVQFKKYIKKNIQGSKVVKIKYQDITARNVRKIKTN